MVVDAMLDGGLLALPEFEPKYTDALERLLTYSKRVRVQTASGSRMKDIRVCCYDYDGGDRFGVRRRLVFPYGYRRRIEMFLKRRGVQLRIVDVNPEKWKKPDTFEFCWELMRDVRWKWLQKETIAAILKYRYAQVKCCTGFGKSFLIKCLCHGLVNSRIVVASHSTDVVRQLYRDISSVTPSVGLITGGKRFGEDRRIVVCSGKSLHRIERCPDLFLVDEGHEFGTDDYIRRVAEIARFSRRYMFSASCEDRPDGADFELLGVFGPVVVRIPYQDAVQHGCVVPIDVRWVRVNSRYPLIPPGIFNPVVKTRIGIWANQLRNNLIAKTARSFQDGEQVLIVVDKIEHAVRLKAILPDFTLVYGENGMPFSRRQRFIQTGLLPADEPFMTSQRRQWLVRQFSAGNLTKVIATGVWNRGVDFRALSVLIRADGLVSPIVNTQIPGRVARTHDETGKSAGLIIDFTDEFDGEFARRAKQRRKCYESHGWSQSIVDSGVASHGCRRNFTSADATEIGGANGESEGAPGCEPDPD